MTTTKKILIKWERTISMALVIIFSDEEFETNEKFYWKKYKIIFSRIFFLNSRRFKTCQTTHGRYRLIIPLISQKIEIFRASVI